MALAKQFGFSDYAQPAGGCCMLTDENYAIKLQDMWANRPTRNYELDDIIMLKMGRHFRLAPHFKLIIGREEGENRFNDANNFTVICAAVFSPLLNTSPTPS